jgi:hypothetical protein
LSARFASSTIETPNAPEITAQEVDRYKAAKVRERE